MNARLYDPVVGRFLSPDPIVQAPMDLQNFNRYSYCLNNPLMYVDLNGESTHVNRNGEVVQQNDDGDDGVYYHYDLSDWDSKSILPKDGGGGSSVGGRHIGNLGGSIDMSDFFWNVLHENGERAQSMNVFDFYTAVKEGGNWDLKANLETIWGLAWKYDQDNRKNTIFTISKSKMTAADFGNLHFGYVGYYTYGGDGMNIEFLSYAAGLAEIKKCLSEWNILEALGRISNMSRHPYYGDRSIDNKWIRTGYLLAEIKKKSIIK